MTLLQATEILYQESSLTFYNGSFAEFQELLKKEYDKYCLNNNKTFEEYVVGQAKFF